MVSRLKLLVLVDNKDGERVKGTWGWSVLVETENWRALFDADSNPEVMRKNTRALGVDLSKLDFAVLSHDHWDHIGGFPYVGQVSKGLTVYVPAGVEEELEKWDLKPVVVRKPVKVAEDAWVIGPVTTGLYGIVEQTLAVSVEGKGLVVIVGCSHPGVDVMCQRAIEATGEDRVYLVIGGFHSPSQATLDRLASKAKLIAPAHCSGEAAKLYVKTRYPDKYVEVKSGIEITIE